jgi:hypothetical protein
MTDTPRIERRFFRLTRSHLLWICPVIGLLAGGAVLWLFGIGLWTAVAFLFLIGCPSVVALVLVIERQDTRALRKQP